MSKNEQMLAEKILQQYEQNILLLPQKNIGHFFERAYRMTGDKKYITILSQYFYIKQVPVLTKKLPTLRNFVNNNIAIELDGVFPKNNSRQRNRYSIYEQNPHIPFFNSLILDLFFINSVGLRTSCCIDSYAEIFDLLKKIDFDEMYYNENTIINVSSFAINSVIFLDHLGLNQNSLKDRVIELIKNYYFDENLILQHDLDKWEYYTFIYNLTHIIIAESHFYEKPVNNHLWIIEYFAKNIQEIIQNTNMDILSEVGLCIKLTKQEKQYETTLKEIKEHILKNYDIEEMMTAANITDKEHTNSIIMLLFFQNNKWHQGPNLSQETIFNNLTLSL